MIFFLNYILMHEILELKDKTQIYSAISTVKGCFNFTEKFKYVDIFIQYKYCVLYDLYLFSALVLQ